MFINIIRMNNQKDPYVILDVARDSNDETIKKAYRKMCMIHHPDRNQNDPNAKAKFQEIQSAYEKISLSLIHI